MEYYTFDCGCRFPVIEKTTDGIPKIDFSINMDAINFECSRTWEMLSSGNTKGCFQLESRLGQSMARKLKPSNIEELSALISIMRPGCLEAIRDGKTVSNHFIDKKNGQESIDYFNPALEPILKTTFGEMVYQEQAMEIAQKIAGFDLQEADQLRKAIGKKKPEEMAKLKIIFIEGCKKNNTVSSDQAEQIFSWIEKSQRYSFNKSHAVSYAINAYLSAYSKAHFPKIFFAAYLKYAKDKIDPQQEIKELVKNATDMDIEICVPDYRLLNQFFVINNNKIYFGLTDIKGVGDSVYKKIIDISKTLDVNNLTWTEILFHLLVNINSTAAKALICSGALSYISKTRTSMLFEYEIISELTTKEIEYVKSSVNISEFSVLQLMNILVKKPKLTQNRKNILQGLISSLIKPPFSMDDKIEWICDNESSLLGINLTYSKVDSYDISMTNTTCKEFKDSDRKTIIVAGEIDNVNIIKIKNGKNKGNEMAFTSISDSTGYIDSVIFFTEQLSLYRNELFEGNILIFKGSKSFKKSDLVVEKCYAPMT
jgi:DNA polymerase III subunit alpha